MCGIAGFVGVGGQGDLARMAGALKHRGPDGEGFFTTAGGVHLAHRRLSILDLEGGAQPMRLAAHGLTVIFNGEIYNFAQLRRELQSHGHTFASHHSDTEVLLHGYRQWGVDLVHRLSGMWAFALLDEPADLLWLNRDRFGKKPLFYTKTREAFVFGSELKALAGHPAVSLTPCQTGLKKYFAYGFTPSPLTVYQNIHQLPGGHHLLLDLKTGEAKVRRYWTFEQQEDPALARQNDDALAQQLRDLLGQAVARRLVADVPVGVFLSGGVDSSTVAALAAQCLGREKVSTFSIGFDEPSFDESQWSSLAASHLGTRHHHASFTVNKALELAPAVLNHLDHPMGDSSLLPTALLCRTARQQVTVALGGDGADELFGGYDPFLALGWAQRYERLVPRPVHRALVLLAGRLPVSQRNLSLDFRLKRTLSGLDHPSHLWLPAWMAPLSAEEISALFGEPVTTEELWHEAMDLWDSTPGLNTGERASAFFCRFYMQEGVLVKVDRASMMFSLEVRSPFLDLEVVDFVRRLPWRLRFAHGQGKILLKKAVAGLLPPAILGRKKKGFGMPVGAWFKQGLLAPKGDNPGGFLNQKFFEQKLTAHQQGREDQRLYLYCQLALEHVHQSLTQG